MTAMAALFFIREPHCLTRFGDEVRRSPAAIGPFAKDTLTATRPAKATGGRVPFLNELGALDMCIRLPSNRTAGEADTTPMASGS